MRWVLDANLGFTQRIYCRIHGDSMGNESAIMDTHTFKIGDRVRCTGVWSYQGIGTVDNFNDWWVIVKMDQDGVKRPFMEGELSHVTPNNIGMDVRPLPG